MLPVTERRLRAEWELLQQLAAVNPGRIRQLQNDGTSLLLHLHGPASTPAEASARSVLISDHAVRIDFPVHFPAVPMELFLATPVFHPNVHPDTGFVCLWERHRVSNTVEHALHKTVAILAGELRNNEPMHVMQPEALAHPIQTNAMPLQGVAYLPMLPLATSHRRKRLQ